MSLICYLCGNKTMPLKENNGIWFWCYSCEDWIQFLYTCFICGKALDNTNNYCDECIDEHGILQETPVWAVNKEFAAQLREYPHEDIVIEFHLDQDGDLWNCQLRQHNEGGIRWFGWFAPYWKNQYANVGPYRTASEAMTAIRGKIATQMS